MSPSAPAAQRPRQDSPPLDPSDPLGLLTEDYLNEPSSYPPLVGSHSLMPFIHSSSSRSSAPYGPRVSSDSEISHLDLNTSNGGTSPSRPGPSRPQGRSRAIHEHQGSGNRQYRGGNRRHTSNNSELRLDIPPMPNPLRIEDLDSEAVTSDSTSYVNGHQHLLANRQRRHIERIESSRVTAALEPLRDTVTGDIHNVGYGYGYEGQTAGDHRDRREQVSSYFDDGMYELSSSSPVYNRETTTLIVRPDIHNSMAPFDGVDPDFAGYQAAELARHGDEMRTPSIISGMESSVYQESSESDPFI